MRLTRSIAIVLALAIPVALSAQGGRAGTSAEPFKLGTFEIQGSPAVGIVLRDSLVVHLDPANAALERNAAYPMIPMPADMLDLISRYEYGVKPGSNIIARA